MTGAKPLQVHYVVLETLALFIRFELAIQTPLAENDAAGRALGAKRFEAFVTQVGRQVSTGRRSLGAAAEAEATFPGQGDGQ